VTRADRIQSYLRTTAHGFWEAVPIPPFTAFFNPRDPLRYLNYAIPDERAEGDLSAPLEELRETFRSRDRLPRFEYVEGFAPGLAGSLEAVGFEVELRAPLMTCPAGEIAAPPRVQGLTVVPAVDDPRATITVGNRAFGAGDEPEASDDDVSEWLVRAVASATPPLDGLSEVAGVGVLERARRRGVGAAMTAAAARAAAAEGAELLFLSPGSDGAQAVYTRVGFRPAETTLYYADPE